MNTKSYNPGDGTYRQKLADLGLAGKTVVCAPRPLPGEEIWDGQYCCGIFWAAGNLDDFQKQWENLGATIILLTSNDRLVAEVEKEYRWRMENSRLNLPSWEETRAKYSDRVLVKRYTPALPG